MHCLLYWNRQASLQWLKPYMVLCSASFWENAPVYISSPLIKTHMCFLDWLQKWLLDNLHYRHLIISTMTNWRLLQVGSHFTILYLRVLTICIAWFFLCFLLCLFCQCLVFVKLSLIVRIFFELGNFPDGKKGFLWALIYYFINPENLPISVLNTGTMWFCLFVYLLGFCILINYSAQVWFIFYTVLSSYRRSLWISSISLENTGGENIWK